MYADPKKVDARRLRRRIKAGLSLVLAAAAGAFLACHRQVTGAPPLTGTNVGGPDARGGSERPMPTAVDATATPVDASLVVSADAGDDHALVLHDATVDARRRTHTVDHHEHRSGMPVRDNLLE